MEFKIKASLYATLLSMVLLPLANAIPLPFEIIPQGTLPTTILEGGVSTAIYTLTNVSGAPSFSTYIKYLPPNVQQVTDDPDYCGARFTLLNGASCNLKLLISGSINALDPNPHNHLFACFDKGATCAGTYYPLNVSTMVARMEIVAGNVLGDTPLLVSSLDGGNSWDKVSSTTSGSLSNGALSGGSCGNNFCVVGGQVYSSTAPLLIVSSPNEGGIWNIVTSVGNGGLPTSGVFQALSCEDKFCVAAGIDFDAQQPPFFISSFDQGNTWNLITSVGNGGLPATGSFSGSSCRGNTCVVVGEDDDELAMGLLVTSLDGGNTWNRVTSVGNGGIPGLSTLITSSCAESTCVAVGINFATSAPFFIASLDGGNTWNKVTNVGNGGLPANGQLTAASCSGEICVVAGFDGTGTEPPLIITSLNGGSTWNKVTNVGNGGLPLNGVFTSASCDQNICVVVGQTSTSDIPFFISSLDGGNTWNKVTSVGNGGLPSAGILNSVSCSNNTCIAAGNSNTGARPAILIQSLDGGLTWNNVTNVSNGGLPASGVFQITALGN